MGGENRCAGKKPEPPLCAIGSMHRKTKSPHCTELSSLGSDAGTTWLCRLREVIWPCKSLLLAGK